MARTYKRDNRGRFASGGGSGGGGGGKRRGAPKTTSARGRALTNQRRATEAVRAGRGGSGPSKKAVRSVLTAQRARAYYASTGTGTKRSAKRAASAAARRKQIRAEIGAKRKAAGRPKARVVVRKAGKTVASRTARLPTEKRLERAVATASRIAKAREQRSESLGAEFARRRAITSGSGRKQWMKASAKEDAASAASSAAMRSWLRAEKRRDNLSYLLASLRRKRR